MATDPHSDIPADSTDADAAARPAGCLHRVCPLCGRDNAGGPACRYSRGAWIIKQCAGCRLAYLENVVPYDELIHNFAWTKSFAQEREFRRRRQPLMAFLGDLWKRLRLRYSRRDKGGHLVRRYVRGGRLLDVGCGDGPMLRRFDERFTPFGIEIGEEAARLADQYAAGRGGRVIHDNALAGLRRLDDDHFDGILMQAYLEHENQPAEVLREVRRVLRPGGRAIIKVPNFDCYNRRFVRRAHWPGFRYPDHVNYFTPATLTAIVEQSGLAVARFRLNDRTPTSDNMWMVAEKPASASSVSPRSAQRAA